MSGWGAAAALLVLALASMSRAMLAHQSFRTPAALNAYARPSTSAEMSQFLAALAERHRDIAIVVPLGQSARHRPVEALLLSKNLNALRRHPAASPRLVALLVGSQHGTEPSGGEALLRLARDIACRKDTPWLETFDFVIIPNANPGGRDLHRRVNGNGVNLSTNFVTLSEPESQSLADALARWRPHIVLDVHESAVFKGKSLARQGYMTDVESQIELANNPNVAPVIREFSRDVLLPAVIARVTAAGVQAQRYLGEITDIHQPITNGGVTAKNLRNYAGLHDAFAFLLENRLDPKDGVYPTPRNLAARISKQYTGITALLDVCRAHRREVQQRTARARESTCEPLQLLSVYALDARHPQTTVRMRRLDGTVEQLLFDDHRHVVNALSLQPPQAYGVTAHQDAIRVLLDRHHIAYHVLQTSTRARVTVQRIAARSPVSKRHGWSYYRYTISERTAEMRFSTGTVWIPLDQPARRLIPLLLDPRSNSSVFQEEPYSALAAPGQDLFLFRVADETP